MGLLDKLKGLVIEEDQPAAPKQAPLEVSTPSPTPADGFAPLQPGGFVAAQTVNQAMVDAIRKQTFARSTPFTQLIAASDNLVDVIPDATMRLKAAQKTSNAGRSGKELADSIQSHLKDVDTAEQQFEQAVQQKAKSEVEGLQRQAEQADTQAQAMQEEIRTASARIQQLQETCGQQAATAAQLLAQAATKQAELQQHQADFKRAADVVRAELKTQQTTILSTLT